MELICTSPSGLGKVAFDLLNQLGDHSRVVLFSGDLGAGKTSLIKAVCKELGCRDDVTSPTFSLVNEYQYNSEVIYHIDLYRLESTDEAIHIGIEDYLFSGNWCFIEWPERIMSLLPAEFATVNIEIEDAEIRKIRILKYTSESKA